MQLVRNYLTLEDDQAAVSVFPSEFESWKSNILCGGKCQFP